MLRMRNGTPSPPFALRSATACKCPDSPRSGTAATALRSCAPIPTTNGLTGRRMCLHIASAAPGPAALTPLRQYARTYPYPGLPATRFALPWRAASVLDPTASAYYSIGDLVIRRMVFRELNNLNLLQIISAYLSLASDGLFLSNLD